MLNGSKKIVELSLKYRWLIDYFLWQDNLEIALLVYFSALLAKGKCLPNVGCWTKPQIKVTVVIFLSIENKDENAK